MAPSKSAALDGRPQHHVEQICTGWKYLFPSDEQRKMFIADPGKYTVKPTAMPAAR